MRNLSSAIDLVRLGSVIHSPKGRNLPWSWRRGCNSQACRNHVGPLSVAALSRFLKIHAAAVIFFCAGGAERLAKCVILLGKLLGAGERVATTQCGRNEC